MKIVLHETRVAPLGLVLHLEVRFRQGSWMKNLTVSWRYLATDDVVEQIRSERDRQHRAFEDGAVPYLPLESWE